MTISDWRLPSGAAEESIVVDTNAIPRESLNRGVSKGAKMGGAGSPADLAEADRLIADLAALVDAGLVIVHQHIDGPVRYGVAPSLGACPGGRARQGAGVRHPPAFPTNTVPESA
jgi:hypothetical protein